MGPERAFQDKVCKELVKRDPNCHIIKKHGGGSFGRQGIADLLVVYKGKPLALEVKKDGGHPTTLQVYSLVNQFKAGALIGIIKPSNWANVLMALDDLEKQLPFCSGALLNGFGFKESDIRDE